MLARSLIAFVLAFVVLTGSSLTAWAQAPATRPAEAIDFEKARSLLRRMQAGEQLSAEERAYLDRARAARQQQQNRPGQPQTRPAGALPAGGGTSVGIVPLSDLAGDARYKGQDGGLYGAGRNAPTDAHLKLAMAAAAQVVPLDRDGKPAVDGRVVLMSIGMSNTTQEFSAFKQIADRDAERSAKLVIVDAAQGGRDAADWDTGGKAADVGERAADRAAAGGVGVDRAAANRAGGEGAGADGAGAPPPARSDPSAAPPARPDPGAARRAAAGSPWDVADARLAQAGVTPAQVQVIWIKQALKGPSRFGDYPAHADQLQKHLESILRLAKQRYPNLRLAYLSSRTYAGYATSTLNPEPYAFESALSVRGVIQKQAAGDAGLNADPSKGEVKAPVALWGAYLWADGTKGRAAGDLSYDRADFLADGTHPSPSGRQKVAKLLLDFFKSDETAKGWFAAKAE